MNSVFVKEKLAESRSVGCSRMKMTRKSWMKRHRSIQRENLRMPRREQVLYANLVEDLQRRGPIRKEWRKFSKLSENEYHCHLSYSWVACWRVERQVLEIEVYYAGSRENAPY